MLNDSEGLRDAQGCSGMQDVWECCGMWDAQGCKDALGCRMVRDWGYGLFQALGMLQDTRMLWDSGCLEI